MNIDIISEEHRNRSFFKGLSDSEIAEILQNGSVKKHAKGQLLVQQGDIPLHLLYVMDGALMTFRSGSEGNMNAIRLLGRGETCMDAVIFMGSISPISVSAVKNSEVLYIKRSAIEKMAATNPVFAVNLLHILAKYYKDALYQLDGLSIKSATQRAGYYLLQLYQGANSEEFVMPFSRYLVASHLGMSFETFSRTLAQIKGLGVKIKGNSVILTDKFALCPFCDEDTAAVCKNRAEKCLRNNNSLPDKKV